MVDAGLPAHIVKGMLKANPKEVINTSEEYEQFKREFEGILRRLDENEGQRVALVATRNKIAQTLTAHPKYKEGDFKLEGRK